MGLFDFISDIVDYKYPYYRNYIMRRALFSEDARNEKQYLPRESLFANKDYENFDLILRKSVKYLSIGGYL
jgi:hypothetical protein